MTLQHKIAPSILSADFTRLGEQLPLIVEAVRRVTALPLDVHLMIEKPERYIETFAKAGATMIDVHVETCPHLHRTLQQIRATGAKVGVAINPHTPFEMIRDIMGEVDRVLVMTVNPGFGGQQLIRATLPKIRIIRAAIAAQGRDIELGVDGGVDASTIRELAGAGADVFVAGNAVFGAKDGIHAAVASLRSAVRSAAR
jgi:ribulose-phosphate 3-epimerase